MSLFCKRPPTFKFKLSNDKPNIKKKINPHKKKENNDLTPFSSRPKIWNQTYS